MAASEKLVDLLSRARHTEAMARVWFGDPKLYPEGKIALRNLLVHERCEAVHANGPATTGLRQDLVRRFEMGHDQLTPTSAARLGQSSGSQRLTLSSRAQ